MWVTIGELLERTMKRTEKLEHDQKIEQSQLASDANLGRQNALLTRVDPKKKGEDRYYEDDDGVRYVSVTAATKTKAAPALLDWAVRQEREAIRLAAISVYEDNLKLTKPMKREGFIITLDSRIPSTKAWAAQMETSRVYGNALHAYIEWYLKSKSNLECEKPDVPKEILWSITQFEQWAKRSRFEPIAIEFQVSHPTHRYAGTLDCLASFLHNGKRIVSVVDWKTSLKIYMDQFLQLSAYANAVPFAMPLIDKDIHITVVRLGKRENDFEVKVEDPIRTQKHFAAFLAALSLYRWDQDCNS